MKNSIYVSAAVVMLAMCASSTADVCKSPIELDNDIPDQSVNPFGTDAVEYDISTPISGNECALILGTANKEDSQCPDNDSQGYVCSRMVTPATETPAGNNIHTDQVLADFNLQRMSLEECLRDSEAQVGGLHTFPEEMKRTVFFQISGQYVVLTLQSCVHPDLGNSSQLSLLVNSNPPETCHSTRELCIEE